MNKTKIIFGLLFVVCLYIVQCAGPYVSENGIYGDYSTKIIGEWHSIDTQWNFEEEGVLDISKNNGMKEQATWIIKETQISIQKGSESSTYFVEWLSDSELKFSSDMETIILSR